MLGVQNLLREILTKTSQTVAKSKQFFERNFFSTLGTLKKYKNSRLAHLFNGTIEIPIDKQSNCYFIDRDGETFKYILSYLRCGEIHPDILDNPGKLHMVKHEANYFHLDELVTKLENLVYETVQLDTSNISVEPRNLLELEKREESESTSGENSPKSAKPERFSSLIEANTVILQNGFKFSHAIGQLVFFVRKNVPEKSDINDLLNGFLSNTDAAKILTQMLRGRNGTEHTSKAGEFSGDDADEGRNGNDLTMDSE